MKMCRLPLYFLLLLFGATLNAQFEEDVLAHYPFVKGRLLNEMDFFGNAEPVGQGPKTIPGVLNEAIQFNGQQAEIFFDRTISTFIGGSQEFTLSFYYRADDLSNQQTLMGKQTTCDGHSQFAIHVGKNISIQLIELDGGRHNCSVSAPIPDYQWHHYVYVRERFASALYIDGRLVKANRSNYHVYIDEYAPFGFNTKSCTTKDRPSPLLGALDEFTIYRKALRLESVEWLYHNVIRKEMGRVPHRPNPRATPPAPSKIPLPSSPSIAKPKIQADGLSKILGAFRSVDETNESQLTLDAKSFTLIVDKPGAYPEAQQLTFRGKYRIKGGLLYLHTGELALKGDQLNRSPFPFSGEAIIGEIYGEKVTIDLFAFDNRLKLQKQ